MNISITGRIILSLVPFVNAAVKQAEIDFPGAGNGAAKLAWVIDTLETIYNQSALSAQQIDPDFPKFEALITSITAMVAAAVTAYNKLGVFLSALKHAA
jgi:hypothetical protein